MTRGPKSVSVGELVSRAETAVANVKQDYLPFVRTHLANLRMLSEAASDPQNENAESAGRWEQLRGAAQDLRSSSATAGYDQLAAVASSLEWLLTEAPGDDPRIAEVAGLHFDAIWRLVEDGAPSISSPEVQTLLSALAKASNHVTRGR